MTAVTVSAASNIALVKYWGKSDTSTNRPATASLSIGLEDLRTETTLTLKDGEDSINGLDGIAATRLIQFLDSVRQRFDVDAAFAVNTANNFPTGSGLASSASGFAAVTLGLDRLLNLNLDQQELTRLARTGSGSAARSVFGGFNQIVLDEDAYAEHLYGADHWPLEIVVAIATEAGKAIGSTAAMQLSEGTSPYYDAWLATHADDMHSARQALADRNFEQLAEISEHNCLKMHATIMTSQPAVHYWLPATVAVMHEVVRLRENGVPAFFTIDAGSQVKVVCEPGYGQQVESVINEVPGVVKTIRTRLGGEPHITQP